MNTRLLTITMALVLLLSVAAGFTAGHAPAAGAGTATSWYRVMDGWCRSC